MSEKFTLHKPYIKFAEEKSQQAYEEFLIKFFMFAKESGNVLVPADINNHVQMLYGLVHTTQGYYYSICTDPDELAKCPEKANIVMGLDILIVRMLDDDEVKGICVNPYSDFPCFIPQEYVQLILDRVSDNPES